MINNFADDKQIGPVVDNEGGSIGDKDGLATWAQLCKWNVILKMRGEAFGESKGMYNMWENTEQSGEEEHRKWSVKWPSL